MQSFSNITSETTIGSIPIALSQLELGKGSYITLALGIVLFYLVNQSLQNKRTAAPFPPGPPADPIIGHLRLIPSEGQSELFHEWSKTYGDVIHLKALGRNIVVLDSLEAAHDLLDKKGSKFSCRPRIVIFEMLGWKECLPFLQYGKQFLKHRKLIQTFFGRQESLAYIPLQIEEARNLVRNLVETKNEHEFFLSKFITAIITRINMGHKISSNDDAILKLIEDHSYATNNAGPVGNTPVDFFPWLRHFPSWFPGAYYGGKARAFRGTIRKLHEYPVEVVQNQLDNGTAQDSFIAGQLQNISASEEDSARAKSVNAGSETDMNDIMGASAAIYGAGTDTSHATLSIFLLIMTLHPEIQRRAQKEIDSVIGKDRLPEYSDRESLPYVEAILQETLRWYPVVPLGLPHRAIEDEIYKGMFIPKGTIVFGNIRGMSMNENTYSSPEKFNPSRYLPKPEGQGEPYFIGPWGFGRRICPGRFLAETGLWIAMATILATVDVLRDVDAKGNEIVPDLSFSVGLVSQPMPFKCRVVPRDARYEKIIEETS